MVKDLLVADRYATALFEIARVLHKDEEIEAELESLSRALQDDPALEKSFANPSLKAEEKRKFLQKIYQERKEPFYETLLDFFSLLFEKDRFNMIHAIAVSFKRIADEAQGQGVAEIRSAVPLSQVSEAAIVSRLEKIAGYKIVVKKEVDPSLVGGVVVKVKNKIIDGSVRYKIDMMKSELMKIRNI